MCARFAGSEQEGYQLTEAFVEQMIDEFREQRKIHPRYALHIVLTVRLLHSLACVASPVSLPRPYKTFFHLPVSNLAGVHVPEA